MNQCSRLKIIIFFCFGFMRMLHAVPVKPIIPGEGVWRIVSRIGECIDTFSLGCEVQFGQAEIGSGDQFVITATSGATYCLTENVTFTTGVAITIRDVKDVTIDLMGHAIDGLNSGDSALLIDAPGSTNITIKNGELRNCSSDMITTADAFVEIDGAVIKDISFYNSASGDAIDWGKDADRGIQRDLLIENCNAYATAGFKLFDIDGATIRGCTIVQTGNEFNFRIEGDPGNLSRYLCIQDCILTGTFPLSSVENDISNIEVAVIERVKYIDIDSDGFDLSDINALYMADCEAMRVANDGFDFNDIFSGEIARCSALDCGDNGFEISECSNLLFRDCMAFNCEGNGFLIDDDSFQLVLDSCVSIGNVDNGFEYDDSNDCKIINCCAANNGGTNYFNDDSSNVFLGNSSFNGASGGFGGSSGVPAVLVNSGATAIAGGSNWTNVELP